MISRKTLLGLLIAIAVAMPGNAQTRGQAGWASKVAKGQGTSVPAVSRDHNGDAEADDAVRVEGTWRGKGTFDSGSQDVFLYTFGAGKSHSNGVVTHSDNLFFVPAPSCLTAQGAWKRTGSNSFIATDEAYCFDSTNDFAFGGTIRFKTAIKLNPRGTAFEGRIHLDAFDPDGNLVFSDDGTIQATRVVAKAPKP